MVVVSDASRLHLVTFGGADYDGCTERAIAHWYADPDRGRFLIYDDLWVERHPFRHQNAWLWEHSSPSSVRGRGFGWYAWKPLIILHALDGWGVADGDVVLYFDGDTVPVRDLEPIHRVARRDGAMFFKAQGFFQNEWCKRDCFLVMGQDEPRYWHQPHAVARFLAVRKGDWKARQLLTEWLTYCVNRFATTFDSSVLGKSELQGFREHRTEQAILTNLIHRYGFRLYREACQAGDCSDEDRDVFPEALFHHENLQNQNRANPAIGSRFRNVAEWPR